MTLYLDSHNIAKLTPNRKCYPLSKPEIEFNAMEEIHVALCMQIYAEKTIF